MIIGIIVNETKDIGYSIAGRLAGAINARGGKSVAVAGAEPEAGGNRIKADGLSVKDYTAIAGCDIIICVGGDGTLIKVARETLCYKTPILGINLGSLGYLTEVETSQIDTMLDRIFDHNYHIEDRMMLSISRMSADGINAADAGLQRAGAPPAGAGGSFEKFGNRFEETAINELAIGRGDFPHVVKLKIYINDTFLDVYPGDGILISTPTGSTAYSLSAGGPVIDPELSVISIVPVCPHVIFSRPVLIAPDKEITIAPVIADGGFRASVSVDGFSRPEFNGDEIIKVRRSDHVTRMLRFKPDNFYTALKNKLFETSNKFGPDVSNREMPANG